MSSFQEVENTLFRAFKPYGDQALQYFRQGDQGNALKYFREKTDLNSETVQSDLRQLGQAINNFAFMRNRMGDANGAQRAYNFAFMIHCELLDRHDPDAAVTLYNLGMFLFQQRNDLKNALKYLVASLEVWKTIIKGEQQSGYIHYLASCLAAISEIFVEEGQLDSARVNLEQALEFREILLPAGHADIGTNLTDLAIVCALQGDAETSRKHYKRAFDLYKATLSPNDPMLRAMASDLKQLERNQIPKWMTTIGKK